MRYGVIPTNLLERIALLSGKVPIPLIDCVFGPLKTRVLMAGVRLGVFEAMRDGAHAPDEVARKLGLDPGGVELLLRALVACDYMVQEGNRFVLSPLARATMVQGAATSLVGYLRFNYRQWEFFEGLEALVRTGRGVDFHETMTDPEDWRNYQQGMLEIARFEAAAVAARVRPPRGARSLLDIAGSHGLFGAAICRRHPPMRSTVLDLPQAVVHARTIAAAEGLADLVTFREGDLRTADLGRDHDVSLLCNILHHFTPDGIGPILSRTCAALRQGGVAAIWEVEAPAKGSKVTSGDGAALFFSLTSTAGAYHGDEYRRWMRDAGFDRVSIARPVTAPGKVLVVGRRA